MGRDEITSARFRKSLLVILLGVTLAIFWQVHASTYSEALAHWELQKEQIPSKLLTAFNHSSTAIEGSLLLPSSSSSDRIFPILYHFPGFGADPREAWRSVEVIRKIADTDPTLQMIHVFMNPTINGGYSYFTDSPNNGPWESAFTNEFIPVLEEKLARTVHIGARFVTGHSSGGWTALWLQLHNPKLFSGVWATAPDPIDFKDFYGVNLNPGSEENFYSDSTGVLRLAARNNALGFKTLKEYIFADELDTSVRGDLASYEWAFSPKGSDGLPLKLFNRMTGALNAQALESWQRFDLRKVFATDLRESREELENKLHIWVGENDEFFLDNPTKLFCGYFVASSLQGNCTIVPGRGHRNLYLPDPILFPQGLLLKILQEISRNSDAGRTF